MSVRGLWESWHWNPGFLYSQSCPHYIFGHHTTKQLSLLLRGHVSCSVHLSRKQAFESEFTAAATSDSTVQHDCFGVFLQVKCPVTRHLMKAKGQFKATAVVMDNKLWSLKETYWHIPNPNDQFIFSFLQGKEREKYSVEWKHISPDTSRLPR